MKIILIYCMCQSKTTNKMYVTGDFYINICLWNDFFVNLLKVSMDG